MISFTVPGEAVPFARAGKNGKRHYTSAKQERYALAIGQYAAAAMRGSKPFEGPVEMAIRAVYLVPASWSKKERAAAKWKQSKPDADNLAKIVKDALSKIVYRDDAQVASLIVQKTYGPIAGLTVSVAQLLTVRASASPGLQAGVSERNP